MLAGVAEDKRTGQSPVPEDLDQFLTQMQMMTLKRIEQFGWRLLFVRRPLFQETVAVIADQEKTFTAILEGDGTMNKHHDLVIRH